ncbi:hypothetical protein [Mycobacterium sp. IDR2000157661]|uniref:hypothetical protein n=1 Tax=Mycobacterium sp. IDR2000157661 TaxID=2867005 RepID=UPI001EEE3B45|nr:hypothetical protein [Mycobacterium sp. IDR2000157661]ULE34798.1 hypothetical protein K3G64_09555 [Mycobacterium sp. IDR2000157661]
MSNISNDPIDDVAPGDLITVTISGDREGADAQPCKVVHKEVVDDGYLVTLEAPDAQTFDVRYPAGTRVTRSLETKWESDQSPTPHRPPTA